VSPLFGGFTNTPKPISRKPLPSGVPVRVVPRLEKRCVGCPLRPSFSIYFQPIYLFAEFDNEMIPVFVGFCQGLRYRTRTFLMRGGGVLLAAICKLVTVVSLSLVDADQKQTLLDESPVYLYHIHIPKTGGTSLKSGLTVKSFAGGGGGHCDLTSVGDFTEIVTGGLKKLQKRKWLTRRGKPCAFISQESPYFAVVDAFDNVALKVPKIITFVRNPIMRYISSREHDMQKNRCAVSVEGLATLVTMDGKCKLTGMSHPQVDWLHLSQQQSSYGQWTNISWARPLDVNSAASALKNLLAFSFFGIVEYYPTSACLLMADNALRVELKGVEFAQFCTCHTSSEEGGGALVHKDHRHKGSKSGDDPPRFLTLQSLADIVFERVADDAFIYPQAMRAFRSRVEAVQTESHVALLCPDTLKEFNAELEGWDMVSSELGNGGHSKTSFRSWAAAGGLEAMHLILGKALTQESVQIIPEELARNKLDAAYARRSYTTNDAREIQTNSKRRRKRKTQKNKSMPI
jgi:hypothetical protein